MASGPALASSFTRSTARLPNIKWVADSRDYLICTLMIAPDMSSFLWHIQIGHVRSERRSHQLFKTDDALQNMFAASLILLERVEHRGRLVWACHSYHKTLQRSTTTGTIRRKNCKACNVAKIGQRQLLLMCAFGGLCLTLWDTSIYSVKGP